MNEAQATLEDAAELKTTLHLLVLLPPPPKCWDYRCEATVPGSYKDY